MATYSFWGYSENSETEEEVLQIGKEYNPPSFLRTKGFQMTLTPLSKLFSNYSKNPFLDQPEIRNLKPVDAGIMIAGQDIHKDPVFSNIGVGFWLWWRTIPQKRKVFRVRQETAKTLQQTNLSFIPDSPPAIWGAGSVLIESVNAIPIVADCFSINAYFTQDSDGQARYYFTTLLAPDGVLNFSISADTQKLNDKLAKEEELLDKPFFSELDFSQQNASRKTQEKALEIIKFIFATSYYIENPGDSEHIKLIAKGGIPLKNKKGKVVKEKGKKVYQWSYSELQIKKREPLKSTSGELNTDNLSLEPTIVSPHIRIRGEKIIIVDSYESHRWKSNEKLGTKVKV